LLKGRLGAEGRDRRQTLFLALENVFGAFDAAVQRNSRRRSTLLRSRLLAAAGFCR
jgi:hypothetical protein